MKKGYFIWVALVGTFATAVTGLNLPTGADAELMSNVPLLVTVEERVGNADVCTGDNLLANPSFEGPYEPYVMAAPGHPDCQTWDPAQPNQYCERVKLPSDWHPWWRSDPRPESWINIQPEYIPSLPHETPPRVRSGEKSQHYFSFWSTHEGGLYQQVAAAPDGRYCFSSWGHAWSARKTPPDYTSDPDDHGYLHQRVGIDPTGGTDWTSPNIIWSDERMQYDVFGGFKVEATAQADTITLFLYSRADVPVKHNDVYWDDAHLSLISYLAVDTETIAIMVEVDNPVSVTHTVDVSITAPMTWTAALDPAGTITPALNPISGDSVETSLEIFFDTTGLSLGTYETTLTVTSNTPTAGSPQTIPITVFVVPEIDNVFLPNINR